MVRPTAGADAAMVYALGDQEEPIDLDAEDMAREYMLLKDQVKTRSGNFGTHGRAVSKHDGQSHDSPCRRL